MVKISSCINGKETLVIFRKMLKRGRLGLFVILLMVSCAKSSGIPSTPNPMDNGNNTSDANTEDSDEDSEMQDSDENEGDTNSGSYFFEDNFRIGVYVSPKNLVDEEYADLKAANVDFIQDISYNTDDDTKIQMLKLAERNDLKMVVANKRVDEGIASIQEMIQLFNKYEATVGYNVKDEPTLKELDDAAKKYKNILSIDKESWPLVNLFPNYATGALADVANYENDYVKFWVNIVGKQNLKFLSFDNYPFVKSQSGDNGTLFRWDEYFQNLDAVRRVGLENNIRTSSYLQSIGSNNDLRRPNENELRLSVYSNLAYGITLPVWFTYRRPNYDFTVAITDVNGEKSDLYEPFKKLNAEMHTLGEYLIHLSAVNVYHTGKKIPKNTFQPPNSFPVNASDPIKDSLIITQFEDKISQDKYIMIVNKSLNTPKIIPLKLTSDITGIKRISKETGRKVNLNISSEGKIDEQFRPGEGNLYLLEY